MCLLEVLEDLCRHAKSDQDFAQRLQQLLCVWHEKLQQLQPAAKAAEDSWTQYYDGPWFVLSLNGPPPPEVRLARDQMMANIQNA